MGVVVGTPPLHRRQHAPLRVSEVRILVMEIPRTFMLLRTDIREVALQRQWPEILSDKILRGFAGFASLDHFRNKHIVDIAVVVQAKRVALRDDVVAFLVRPIDHKLKLLSRAYQYICLKAPKILIINAWHMDIPGVKRREFPKHVNI